MKGSKSPGTEKVCKQCGKLKPIVAFRQYPRRGQGIRNVVEPGYYTICKDCQSFNTSINYLYKAKLNGKVLSQQDEQLLVDAARLYKAMYQRGLQPLGKYARDVLGLGDWNIGSSGRQIVSPPDYLAEMAQDLLGSTDLSVVDDTAPVNEQLIDRFKAMLEMEFTEDPDYYEDDMLDEIEKDTPKDPTNPNRLAEPYRTWQLKVLDKIAEYRDRYYGEEN
jgi:hypothetical protein